RLLLLGPVTTHAAGHQDRPDLALEEFDPRGVGLVPVGRGRKQVRAQEDQPGHTSKPSELAETRSAGRLGWDRTAVGQPAENRLILPADLALRNRLAWRGGVSTP